MDEQTPIELAQPLAAQQCYGEPCWECGEPSVVGDHVPPLSSAQSDQHWKAIGDVLRSHCSKSPTASAGGCATRPSRHRLPVGCGDKNETAGRAGGPGAGLAQKPGLVTLSARVASSET